MTKTKTFEVITAPACFPLKKGDIVIERRTAFYLKGGIETYFTLAYVGKGGKKPRDGFGSPIYLDKVAAVIRKGWELPVMTGTAATIEEAVELAQTFLP